MEENRPDLAGILWTEAPYENLVKVKSLSSLTRFDSSLRLRDFVPLSPKLRSAGSMSDHFLILRDIEKTV